MKISLALATMKITAKFFKIIRRHAEKIKCYNDDMKLCILMSLLLSSCAFVRYDDSNIRFFVWTIGTDFNADEIQVLTKECAVNFNDIETKQSDAAGKMTEGAVKGAIQCIKGL